MLKTVNLDYMTLKFPDMFTIPICSMLWWSSVMTAKTPYMMKFVDVFPKHLCSTPFKSLMRVATEGGERTHYMHICFYYQVCKTNTYKWLLVLTSVGSSSLLSYSWQNLSLCFQHSTRHLFWFHESRWMPPTFQRKYLAICWSYHGFHQFGY